VFRSATPLDLDAILAVEPTDLVSPLDPERFREDVTLHRHRLEWTWIAEERGQLTAFALWWGLAESAQPTVLSQLWVSPEAPDPSALAGALLHRAVQQLRRNGLTSVPEVELDLPGDWQHDATTRAAVEWRQAACRSIAVSDWNERRQQEWTHDYPVPQGSDRLHYAPASDDEFLDLFRRVAVGSLDVLTRRTLAELGPDGQAQDDLDFYLSLPGDRALWRVATDEHGAVVGFAIPSRSAYDASVSYLGVVPEHRGHRYVDDLLAEITRIHAEAGAVRITGTTDSTNLPMLAAFARAGYVTTGTRLVGTEPAQLE
jgi:ribosomal protein S18 acetylase RimI-like enzyme